MAVPAAAATPTFAPRKDYPIDSLGATKVVTADLRGQLKEPDVIVISNQDVEPPVLDRKVSVLLNKRDGSGDLEAPVDYSIPYGQSVNAAHLDDVAVGDVDGDQIPDIVLVADGGPPDYGIWVLLGRGDGTFKAPPIHSAPFGSLNSIALGDFNGDHKLDVAGGENGVPCCGPEGIEILRGNGDGTFEPPANCDQQSTPGVSSDCYGVTPWISYVSSVQATDLNGDGKLDLVADSGDCAYITGVIGVVLGNGDGTFHTRFPHPPDRVDLYLGGTCPQGPAIADFNGDKTLDLAASTGIVLQHHHDVTFLDGDGTGAFAQGRTSSFDQDVGLPVATELRWRWDS